MIAYASTSGGVMFIPESIERKEKQQTPMSYKDLLAEEKPQTKKKAFGKKIAASVIRNQKDSQLRSASI